MKRPRTWKFELTHASHKQFTLFSTSVFTRRDSRRRAPWVISEVLACSYSFHITFITSKVDYMHRRLWIITVTLNDISCNVFQYIQYNTFLY